MSEIFIHFDCVGPWEGIGNIITKVRMKVSWTKSINILCVILFILGHGM